MRFQPYTFGMHIMLFLMQIYPNSLYFAISRKILEIFETV